MTECLNVRFTTNRIQNYTEDYTRINCLKINVVNRGKFILIGNIKKIVSLFNFESDNANNTLIIKPLESTSITVSRNSRNGKQTNWKLGSTGVSIEMYGSIGEIRIRCDNKFNPTFKLKSRNLTAGEIVSFIYETAGYDKLKMLTLSRLSRATINDTTHKHVLQGVKNLNPDMFIELSQHIGDTME